MGKCDAFPKGPGKKLLVERPFLLCKSFQQVRILLHLALRTFRYHSQGQQAICHVTSISFSRVTFVQENKHHPYQARSGGRGLTPVCSEV